MLRTGLRSEERPPTDSIPINRGGISKDSPKGARCPPGEVQEHSTGCCSRCNGLGQCVGFSTATQENSARISGRASRRTLLGRTDSHGGISRSNHGRPGTACNAICWRGDAIGCAVRWASGCVEPRWATRGEKSSALPQLALWGDLSTAPFTIRSSGEILPKLL
jgi:hypothetical protein